MSDKECNSLLILAMVLHAIVYHFLSINDLLMNIDGEETTPEQNLLFHHMCIENKNSFLLYDQINKEFGQEIYTLDNRTLKVVIFLEIEKIKKYLDVLNKLEKLEGNLYVFT